MGRSTKWLKIKRDLEVKIIKGYYKSATKLPSLSEMSELYACGESTAQKVMDCMCREGTLVKRRGIGYFLKPLSADKLVKQHVKTMEINLEQCIRDARSLGISKDLLEQTAQKYIGIIYSR